MLPPRCALRCLHEARRPRLPGQGRSSRGGRVRVTSEALGQGRPPIGGAESELPGPACDSCARAPFVGGGGCAWVQCPCGGSAPHTGRWVLGWRWCLRRVVWLSAPPPPEMLCCGALCCAVLWPVALCCGAVCCAVLWRAVLCCAVGVLFVPCRVLVVVRVVLLLLVLSALFPTPPMGKTWCSEPPGPAHRWWWAPSKLHLTASTGVGTPRGRSSTGERRDNGPLSASETTFPRLLRLAKRSHNRCKGAFSQAQRQLLRCLSRNTPANHPPTEACAIHSKLHRGCRVQDPGTRGYRGWKAADFSHSAARCAPQDYYF